MPQEILDLLARLPELTDQELDDLESLLLEEFDRVDGENKSNENVALLGEIANAIDTVRGTRSERQSQAEENERAAADLRARVHAEADDAEDGEGDADGDDTDEAAGDDAEGGAGDGTEGTDEEDEDGTGAGATGTPEARRAASAEGGQALSRRVAAPPRPTMAQMNAARRGGARPTAANRRAAGAEQDRITTRFFARRPTREIAVGDDLNDRMQLASIEADLVNRLVASAGTGEMLPMYGVHYNFPERYDLRSPAGKGNLPAEEVSRRFEETIPASLVAAGGVCNPVDVDYNVPVFSVTDEPIYDSLPKYQANRGGLRFITPPTFAGTAVSGFTVWTEAVDAAPGGTTKASQTIVCATENEVYVDALVSRVRIGNMMGRFSPEIVDANQTLIQAKHAQQRELYLLNKINAASTLVSSAQLLGAARDLLGTLDQVAAAYRWRSRLSRNTTLRVIFPEWVIDMIRADLMREMAHGQEVSESFSLTDTDVESLLRARNVVVTWAIDGVAAGTGYGYQGFGAQGAGAAAVDWPHQVSWNIFAEGSFQVIDGGELNVGVVRDSTLNNTNDYEQFEEVFRNVAFRGYEALQVVSTVRPNGLSAGTVNTSTY